MIAGLGGGWWKPAPWLIFWAVANGAKAVSRAARISGLMTNSPAAVVGFGKLYHDRRSGAALRRDRDQQAALCANGRERDRRGLCLQWHSFRLRVDVHL